MTVILSRRPPFATWRWDRRRRAGPDTRHRRRPSVVAGVFLPPGVAPTPPPPPPPPAVTVAAVEERKITEWDEFTGRLEAVDQVEIRPRVSGYIKRVAFAEGKEVKKGEVLFEIDPRPYQADLERAQAELEQARTAAALAAREVERAPRSWWTPRPSRARSSTPGRAPKPTDRARVRAAQAAVATARLNLEWTRVRSPIAGRVSNALVTAGNLVQAGPPTATLLTTVVSLDPIYAYFEGDEQTYLAVCRRARRAASRCAHPIYLGRRTRTAPSRTRAASTSWTTRSIPGPGRSGPARSSPTRTTSSRPASSRGSSWSAARR